MNDREEKKPSARSMQRSKVQLSTAYAPGTLFTLEGDLVACETKPASKYHNKANISNYSGQQIYNKIEEKVSAWYRQAKKCRNDTIIKPEMCVDKSLLNNTYEDLCETFPKSIFSFVDSNEIAYQPTLLTFVCNNCKMVKDFSSLNVLNKKSDELRRENCPDIRQRRVCDWRQMDIVFIHPNGNYMSPVPWRYEWSEKKADYYRSGTSCNNCPETKVRLDDDSPQIGKRYFKCAACNTPRNMQWLQNDKEWVRLFESDSSIPFAIKRMKPISYRSNAVHYTQQDIIIDFEKSDVLDALSDNTNDKLLSFIGSNFDLDVSMPDESEIEKLVIKHKSQNEWNEYINLKSSIKTMENDIKLQAVIAPVKNRIKELEDSWKSSGIIETKVNISNNLLNKILDRDSWFSSQHDPFRFLVEHQALLDTHIENDNLLATGKKRYTPLDKLDEFLGPSDESERDDLNIQHKNIMEDIGIDEIGLIRDFKLIHFSYGYTRVGSTPSIEYINNQTVPVRLKLFEKTSIAGERSHPIYVINQKNDAIYVKLNEKKIITWLKSIEVEGILDEKLGIQYLENVPKMNSFLDGLPEEGLTSPNLSLAIYTLLHSFAHHILNAISEFSGLSVSSLGEYLFPADFAFVIYRRGSTIDLGNLTSMIRDNAPAFMKYLQDYKNLECGSGSLCINRGGACPDCLFIPEVSCITQNKLLSRSVLNGKHHPGKYGFTKPIKGFYNL